MAFCGVSHHTANQRATDYYTTFLLVIITIRRVLTYLNHSSLKIKHFSRCLNAVVVYTSNCPNLARPFKAPSRCHISYTSTIIIDSSSRFYIHILRWVVGDCLTIGKFLTIILIYYNMYNTYTSKLKF